MNDFAQDPFVKFQLKIILNSPGTFFSIPWFSIEPTSW